MTVALTPAEYDGVVARLRSAGCVFAEDETELLVAETTDRDRLSGLIERRVAGEPLETILGWVAFCGLRVPVVPGVFVPRRRTEFLVEQALARLSYPGVVIDLCCGSGAIGLAIKTRRPDIELHATEVDPVAARCAAENLIGFGTVHLGDLFTPLPVELRGTVDVIVANVPYVPSEEIGLLPPEARLYEPALSLDGGTDGLAIARRVAAEAPRWLRPGGALLIETSTIQAAATAEFFAAAGLDPDVIADSERGATVVAGVARA